MPINHGGGHVPVLGFDILLPDPGATTSATADKLEVGFREFDYAERYRNGREVGETLQTGVAAQPDPGPAEAQRSRKHAAPDPFHK